MRHATQPDLLTWSPPPNARANDPDTSIAAANLNPLLRHTDRRAALLALYHATDGLTDFELGEAIGRKQTSAGKRRGELRDEALARDSGQRRPSDTGSPSIVWCLTEDGRAEARKLEE